MESSQDALRDNIHLLHRRCRSGLGSRRQQWREPVISTSPRTRFAQHVWDLYTRLDQFWSLHWKLVRPSSLMSLKNTLTRQKVFRMLGIGPPELLLWTTRQVTRPTRANLSPDKAIGAIFIAANFCFWAVIGSACAQTWQQLLLCRLLVGIGMGVNGSSVPIFAAENSPAAIRGALVMSWRKNF